MEEKIWGRPDQLVICLSEGIDTLYKEENVASPILREVAYSMWNQCLKLHDEGLVKLQRDFTDIDDFIELMKNTGAPEEIRSNQEHLAKVLSAGVATLFEKEDVASPLLRTVAHSIRKGCGKVPREGPPRERMEPPPFKAMTMDQLDQFLEQANKMREPDEPEDQPKRWRDIKRHGDTILWQIEPPKDKAGNYICGCMLVRGKVLTTKAQIYKVCVVCDVGVLKNLVERLVKHPVIAEQIYGPATHEGADRCYAKIHLSPPAGRLV